MDIHNIINQFRNVEASLNNDPQLLQALEKEIESLALKGFDLNLDFCLFRNEFRVRHAAFMKVRRPRVLVGLINYEMFPNFQTVPLFKCCDFVSLARPGVSSERDDRLEFLLESEDISQAVDRLPTGFEPDYYWDPQVCGTGISPVGLENLPFISVAGVCHMYRGVVIESVGQLYDCLAPVSKTFVPILKAQFPNKHILDIPFGGNWGSFEFFNAPVDKPRDYDLLITFSTTERVEYGGYRNQALELAKDFKQKYGEKYNVVFFSNLDKEAYRLALSRAKIALNVAAFNGPYNYRSCEIMNSGAALMQMDISFGVVEPVMSDYFCEGVEYIAFNQENFEDTLLDYLDNQDKIRLIAKAGQHRLNTEYSYQKIHGEIFREISTIKTPVAELRANNLSDPYQAWLKTLLHAPAHHKARRNLFAILCCGLEDTSNIQIVRYLIVALPWLVKLHGNSAADHIRNPVLASYLRASLFHALEFLFFSIPEDKRTLSDKWAYMCHRALYQGGGVEQLNELIGELENVLMLDPLSINLDQLMPLDFGVATNLYENARKEILEIPYCLSGSNTRAKSEALIKLMIWWCQYFQNAQLAGQTVKEETASL